MDDLVIEPNGIEFRPGDRIEGDIRWSLGEAPESIAIRLLWKTSGRGDTDVAMADERVLERPGTSGRSSFKFFAPSTPPSFSGRLITLEWVLEAQVLPIDIVAHADLVIGPEAREVRL